MNPAAAVETIPTQWVDARDVPFFRTTTALFDAEFVFGASVLLASYDDVDAPVEAEISVAVEVAARPTATDRRYVAPIW